MPANRTIPCLILSSCLVTLCAPAGAAAERSQPASTPPAAARAERPAWMKDPTNAALLYSRAWITAPDGLSEKVGEYSSDAGWKPSDELCKLLAENQGHVDALCRAASLAEADFGVEYSQGFMALLPHLGKLRASARTLACDARCKQIAGDADGAARRTAMLFGIASHSKSDRLLISSLVCVAVHQLACNQVKSLIEAGTLTEAGRDAILEQMRRFDGPDAFGMRAAILGERDTATFWLGEIIRGPQPGKRMAEALAVAGNNGRFNAALSDPKALEAELAKMSQGYEALIAAWDTNDPAAVGRVEAQAGEGKFGLLSGIVMPALNKARQAHEKAVRAHADTRAALKAAKVSAPAAPTKAPE